MTIQVKLINGSKHYYMVVGGLHVPVPSEQMECGVLKNKLKNF